MKKDSKKLYLHTQIYEKNIVFCCVGYSIPYIYIYIHILYRYYSKLLLIKVYLRGGTSTRGILSLQKQPKKQNRSTPTTREPPQREILRECSPPWRIFFWGVVLCRWYQQSTSSKAGYPLWGGSFRRVE